MAAQIRNTVTAKREQRGLSAARLAAAVGISRQAMYAIEAGTYVPNTGISLRLARELGVPVEELFALETEAAADDCSAVATIVDPSSPMAAGEPVQLCYVNERLVATQAAPSTHWLSPADGFAQSTLAGGKKVRVDRHRAESLLRNRLLLSGCDPAMSLLTRHLERAGVELVLVHQNSSQSLAALKRGDIHIAGTHLRRAGAKDANLSAIGLTFAKDSVAVLSFALWQEGLVTAPGNPKGIRTVADLARRNVRLINREKGAGCRALLDAQLLGFGLKAKSLAGYEREERGHLAAASHVKSGEADCCIATQAAARVFGLDFVPIEQARYDFVLRKEDLGLTGVQKLFDAISQSNFQRELASVSGYDTRVTGARVL